VRFTADAHPGLADGSVRLTFRAWKRPQVKVGGRYRVGPLHLEVDEIDSVPAESVSDDEARLAGFADRHSLLAYLDRRVGGPVDGRLFRVAFHRVDPPEDPALHEQEQLSDDDAAELDRRLDRLDQRSPLGPWTRDTLRLIARRPAVVSTELARELGRERFELKADIRKLKKLGLTESLEVGYRLSPRGRAYLSRRR
jgi:hypothetical protein